MDRKINKVKHCDNASNKTQRINNILQASSLDPTVQAAHERILTGDKAASDRRFVRSENEDDDGYDPYSDRPAHSDDWERDPWQ